MTINLKEFLALDCPCIDVRSPKEFLHAKIPGAISLPLFTDEERAIVGTLYKMQGKEAAIREGIKIVGPKLDGMLSKAQEALQGAKKARIYCWRGGMRSGFVRYFLDFAGISSLQLKGGYKAYRRYVQEVLTRPYRVHLLGGLTGSGKTEMLEELQKRGEQVLDLEALACHRGSVYGEMIGKSQPSCEQFENEIAYVLEQSDASLPIWIEDESRLIGRCQIPGPMYEAMQKAPLYLVSCSKEERVERIFSLYTTFSKEQLKAMTEKLQKRLGGQTTKTVLSLIDQDLLREAIRILLDYYDKAYQHAIEKHIGPVSSLDLSN